MKRFQIHLYYHLVYCFVLFFQVKCIVLQLLRGLEYLHHNFIIHRSVAGVGTVKAAGNSVSFWKHLCISFVVLGSFVLALIHKLIVIVCTWREIFCGQCLNLKALSVGCCLRAFLSSNFSQKATLWKTGEWLGTYRTFYFLHVHCLCRSLDLSNPSSPLTFVLIKAVCESPSFSSTGAEEGGLGQSGGWVIILSNLIIRDLKVSNLLMTDKGCVKIGESPPSL